MKILTGNQISQADRYTTEHEPIESINLMERAARTIAEWICQHLSGESPLAFFIGKGNNGGDGLAVARMLHHAGYNCSVYLCFEPDKLSPEARINLKKLPTGIVQVNLPASGLPKNTVIIDALLGTGVHGAVSESLCKVIRMINRSECRVISIDLPSGMLSEFGNTQHEVVQANTTLSLEFPKLALLLPEGGNAAGETEILSIGLNESFMDQSHSPYFYSDQTFIRSLVKPRHTFDHKGVYGHALLICGATGMVGAAILSAGAALRSGCGLVTLHLPGEERTSVYSSIPPAMVSSDPMECFSQLPLNLSRFEAIGCGCGIGQRMETLLALEQLLNNDLPMVLDADALNLIASHPRLLEKIPPKTILTPHLGELQRLIGPWESDQHRIAKTGEFSARYGCYTVVKGAHTMIATPEQTFYFNSTGNPGMAKGGSGDLLTGLLTGLLARGYDPLAAAQLGVWLHGRAGDLAARHFGQEAFNSADLLNFFGEAWNDIQ